MVQVALDEGEFDRDHLDQAVLIQVPCTHDLRERERGEDECAMEHSHTAWDGHTYTTVMWVWRGLYYVCVFASP